MAKYWFRQRRFGYGAGLPISWEGWAVVAAFIGGVVALLTVSRIYAPHGEWPLLLPVGVGVMLIVLVPLIRSRTEGGWRWRNGEDN